MDDHRTVRIPGFLVKAMLGTGTEDRSIYDDTETSYWFATLQYGKDESISHSNDSKPYLETSFGSGYWLTYDNWTRSTPAPGKEDIALMFRAVEFLHNGDLGNWVWEGGGATGLTSFMLIRKGDQYLLVENDRRLLLPLEDGGFRSMMSCPEGGHFDGWFFK